ncbi:hypothetical protein IAT40_005063 [Kwoniella sp. CBS 6097]
MPRDLGERAQGFRERWLAPSGGWLAELVILISDLTGIWDIVILSGVFVCAWIVIRTSPMEIALILGLGFDMTIPLQYQNDDRLSSIHADHLANYWPVLMIGCLCEIASFFLLHPDLFTLIVCVKTTFMMLAWLSRDQEGLPIVKRRSSRLDDYDDAISDAVGAVNDRLGGQGRGGTGRGDDRRSSGRGSSDRHRGRGRSGDKSGRKSDVKNKNTSTSDSSVAPSSSADERRSSKSKRKSSSSKSKSKSKSSKDGKKDPKPSSSSTSSSSSSGPRNMPKSKHVSSPYKYLHKAGYTDPAIAGMIMAMNKADKDRARKNMKTWCKETDKKNIARRNKQYAEEAKKNGWPHKFDKDGNPLSGGKSGSGGTGGGRDQKTKKNKLAIPVDSVRKVEALLPKSKLESVDQKKILKILKDPKDKKQIEAVTKQLKKLGIDVNGPDFKEGYGEPDGKGGFRDIVLKDDIVGALLKGMARRQLDKATQKQWTNYIQQPRSRGEIERKIIPLCKRVDVYLGDGYIGGGRHRLDPKSIQDVKANIMKRTGVSTEMADHMLLKAMNESTVEAVNKTITRWQQKGLPKEEYEAFRKSMPDWA